ncbi:MAG: phosphate ABC transporter permease subunit PstC [Spirochaetes bacterium]|nr:phosphate ABC transporter permease subunit PstC [Spirochaetota bacterium]MBU0954049.1 phosphate ABC transporter permease subunit PstC [Spirochaetota bacterium]
MKNTRLATDTFFRYLIRFVSLFSVLALAAMLLFVFVQGAEPFLTPTSDSIRLVAQNIPAITVNGTEYVNHSTFIPVDLDSTELRLEFVNRGQPLVIPVQINNEVEKVEDRLSFPAEYAGATTYPEAYTWMLKLPGTIVGLEQSVTILFPEPPYNFFSFLGGQAWRPTHLKLYGILTMIVATIISTFGAVLIGVPLALLAAVLIGEFMPRRLAAIVRSGIDLLAGIPSVVYGFFGLMIIVPLVQRMFDAPSGSSLISAIFILSVMVLPTIVAITITSLQAVPRSWREASLAVGASKMQTAWRVVFPAARSGILAGIILGVSRAIGETMAVILVAGNSPQFPTAFTDSVRTLTATIALEMGYAQGRHSQMLFSVGIVLFIMILILNTIVLRLKKHLTKGL